MSFILYKIFKFVKLLLQQIAHWGNSNAFAQKLLGFKLQIVTSIPLTLRQHLNTPDENHSSQHPVQHPDPKLWHGRHDHLLG